MSFSARPNRGEAARALLGSHERARYTDRRQASVGSRMCGRRFRQIMSDIKSVGGDFLVIRCSRRTHPAIRCSRRTEEAARGAQSSPLFQSITSPMCTGPRQLNWRPRAGREHTGRQSSGGRCCNNKTAAPRQITSAVQQIYSCSVPRRYD